MLLRAILIALLALPSVAQAVVNISSSDTFPYYLNTAGETYVLTENISCSTTCFQLSQSNVTLDLNGKTMTFGTLASDGLTDASFENWTDASTPINWTVLSGTATRVDSKQQLGNYAAQLSSTAAIKSSNITLTANQTYVYYAIVKGVTTDSYTISVRDATDDSVLATTTLTAHNLGSGYAMDNGIIAATEHQYKPTTSKTVYLHIVGTGSSTKTVHYADIRPAKSFGVVYNSYRNTAITPDLPDVNWRSATNFTLRNGTITQGVGKHVKSAAVFAGTRGTYTNLVINLTGNNTAGIAALDPGTLLVDNVDIVQSSMFEFTRTHPPAPIDVTMVPNTATSGIIEIKNCDISDFPEYGIRVTGFGWQDVTTNGSTLIHHNTLQGNARNTEPYAITLSGGLKNVQIYENTIAPKSPGYGRGILLDAVANRSGYFDGSENVSVYSNTISSIKEKENIEYARGSLESVGIRVRNWGSTDPIEKHKNLKIYDNTITTSTDNDYSHASYGINITMSGEEDDIEIYNNTITAMYGGSTSGDWVAGIAMQDTGRTTAPRQRIHHNDITTNFYGIGFAANDTSSSKGSFNIGIYSNIITGSMAAVRFGMSTYGAAVIHSDIDFYCNQITNNGATGYPFYFNGIISDLRIDYNQITNSNSSGYEVWADDNESADVLFFGNGTIDVTGGGSVGTAGAATNGSAGCYTTAGPTGGDLSPPFVTITSPTTASTYDNGATATVSLGGTASDNVAVSSVAWTCATCTPTSGNATGTTTWSFGPITLSNGANSIVVAATDSSANTGSDSIAVTYTAPTASGGVLKKLSGQVWKFNDGRVLKTQ